MDEFSHCLKRIVEALSLFLFLDSESNEDVTKLSEKRVKRHTNSDDAYESKPTNTRCSLLLVADYRFFQRMGGSNTTTTVNYLVITL